MELSLLFRAPQTEGPPCTAWTCGIVPTPLTHVLYIIEQYYSHLLFYPKLPPKYRHSLGITPYLVDLTMFLAKIYHAVIDCDVALEMIKYFYPHIKTYITKILRLHQ